MFKRLWYDARARSVLAQVFIACVFFGTLAWLAWNAHYNLTQRGITTGFGYLADAARFPISESLLDYRPTDSYARAFAVGLANTLYISVLVIAASTVLGFLLALARRSRHPLVNGIATLYLEITRNTPLVVQLLFWYSLVTINLPSPRHAFNPLPGVFLSIRGLFFPSLQVHGQWWPLPWLLLAAAVAWLLLRPLRKRRPALPLGRIIAGIAVIACALAWQWGGMALSTSAPQLKGLNFVGGTALTPEFTALLVGLTLYSAAFSGEIIRGGIDAVAPGQWEAAQSLGLRPWTTLRQVIVPQSLRVIVPPMTSQYLSIVKNTTLALAVGYPDLSFVITTTINQTGQAIEGLAILMAVYLCISLSVSLFMNLYNRRILRTERK
ncbi:L-amino acid ABC transporter permease [Bordetella ansorpii]|uniref:L-amino acid ABC transporter permease n=1 Tax=Bordetella ansorpii TaxID=288768 RepID=A0A157RPT2_9BORD|nr:ABC transporter permease subunit [Bordetella ansorpii]SAI59876.1 L-amino acid ABC transporter permease [Bordetella ansorpii]